MDIYAKLKEMDRRITELENILLGGADDENPPEEPAPLTPTPRPVVASDEEPVPDETERYEDEDTALEGAATSHTHGDHR